MKCKKEEYSICGSIIFLVLASVLIFKNDGINAVFSLWKNLGQIFIAIPTWLNMITLSLIGDSLITYIYGGALTFFIVGIILSFINAPKGKIGSIFGKVLFWVVGFPVSFILNFFGKIIWNS